MRNLQKGTTELSSGGPKIVEMSYGVAGNGLKWLKNQEITGDPRWPPPPLHRPDPGASGAVGREILRQRSSLGGTPPCPAHVQ